MGKLKARDDDDKDLRPAEDDTEGHGLLIDPYSARKLDNSRVADTEREARERALRKEARSNR
jgi:hypothetical protein